MQDSLCPACLLLFSRHFPHQTSLTSSADEAAAATDKRKQLYALAPTPPAARLARLAAAQQPAAFDAAAPPPPFVLESAAADVVVARLERAVHAAMAAEPPYDGIKLRSTLGKQLYGGGGGRGGIASPAALGRLSLADLQVGCRWGCSRTAAAGPPLWPA